MDTAISMTTVAGAARSAELRQPAHRPRVLFIARAFPPTVGGMESLAYQLAEHLRSRVELTTLVNRRGKKALPAFLPYATVGSIRTVRRARVDVGDLGDALFAPVGAVA